MIGGRRPISGRKPGDKRVRVERHHAPYFRYTGPGQMTAKAAASAPTTTLGVIRVRVKGALLGRPLANEEEIGQRLSKTKALAIFSSDAISSSAYATEEIILAFVLAGVAGLGVRLRRAGRDRDRRAARDRRVQLPPGLPRLPQRRRVVLGVEGQLRPDGVAGRRVGADDRLHADGRGLDLVGGRAAVVGDPGPRPLPGGGGAPRDRADHAGQPPRPARGRQHLRDPDLPVPRLGVPDDRRRDVPDRVPGRHRPRAHARGHRRHDPDGEGRDDPDPAPRVRRRRRRAHRHRGDRDRRAGVQAARGPGTRRGR